tara:strand:- start:334 stop:1197 length:864 start_codon:yes stop_codon:yes gene_type:complete
MTAIYSISLRLPLTSPILTNQLTQETITAVIPAFNDQPGLTHTLAELDHLNLEKIIVVDDGSANPMALPASINTPTMLIRHSANKGAAAARNTGVAAVTSDWVYFTDCGCSPSQSLVKSFIHQWNMSKAHTIAIAGPVEAQTGGRLAYYYTHQGILNAPMFVNGRGEIEVEAIITANALIYRKAIEAVGGFDETFLSAGGEDTDLGIRLRTVGNIEWCSTATVIHAFKECLTDFDSRMLRYGRGMRRVSDKFGFDLCPRPFTPFDSLYTDLADRQYHNMLIGFSENR